MSSGKLILFPNFLGKQADKQNLVYPMLSEYVGNIDGLIAESTTGALQFLKSFRTQKPPHQMPLYIYNKHNKEKDFDFIFEPVLKGENWGMISDAGLPCVADPGGLLVAYARKKGIQIEALFGPSSIFMSLMLSGFNGQRFSFWGYLAAQQDTFLKELKKIEELSKKERATQIFIEAPFRNERTLSGAMEVLDKQTGLCGAKEIMLPDEWIVSQKVQDWTPGQVARFKKVPAIFLIDYYAFRKPTFIKKRSR